MVLASSRATAPKTALVTGSARRIGRAIALRLARAGYDLALHHHRSREAAASLVEELAELGRRALPLAFDLAEPDAPERLADAALEAFGRLDLLVNNASLFYPTPLASVTAADWDRLMAVNARAPFMLAARLGARMKEAGAGSIVSLVDAGLDVARADYAAYQASKSALEAASRSLARALAPEVRVNAVAPGAVLLPEDPRSAVSEAELTRRVPLGRLGTPEEIAEAVLFLAEGPAYVTGAVLTVDGGRRLC